MNDKIYQQNLRKFCEAYNTQSDKRITKKMLDETLRQIEEEYSVNREKYNEDYVGCFDYFFRCMKTVPLRPIQQLKRIKLNTDEELYRLISVSLCNKFRYAASNSFGEWFSLSILDIFFDDERFDFLPESELFDEFHEDIQDYFCESLRQYYSSERVKRITYTPLKPSLEDKLVDLLKRSALKMELPPVEEDYRYHEQFEEEKEMFLLRNEEYISKDEPYDATLHFLNILFDNDEFWKLIEQI